MGMLVLARKRNEKVNIYDGKKYIGKVVVVDIDRGKIRLGFEMPGNIRIFREEIDFDQERPEKALKTVWGAVGADNEN